MSHLAPQPGERTPAQTWTNGGHILLILGCILLAATLAVMTYVKVVYGYWNLPSAVDFWLDQGFEEDYYSIKDTYTWVYALVISAGIAVALSFGASYKGHQLRQKEIAQFYDFTATQVAGERNFQLTYSEVVQGAGPMSMQKHLVTLQSEASNLEKVLVNEIQLKEIELRLSGSAAKQRVRDEMTLLEGMVDQIRKVNKIKATDAVLGQQVWGEWQRTKADRASNY